MPLWVWAFCIASIPGWTIAQPAPARTIRIGPYIQSLGPNGVEIRAELEAPAAFDVTLNGPAAPPKRRSSRSTMHGVVFEGLEARTRYTYTAEANGGKVEGAFVTAPKDDATEPFTALLYGDNRTDDAAHAVVVKEMARTPSDLLLHTGDFVSDSRQASEWSRFFSIEGALLRDRCVFAAIGNHDLLDDGDAYKRYFGRFRAHDEAAVTGGEVNWTMRWQFVRFWFVNAMDASPATWLLSDLGAHDAEAGIVWRVVVLHHGPYSSGPHGGNDGIGPATVDQWRNHGVDLVLAGHDHIYERGYARTLGYVISGGGGAPSYKIADALKTTHTSESARHFVELKFAPSEIELAAHRSGGALIEKRTFRKGLGWDEDIAKNKSTPGGTEKSFEKPEEKTSWIGPAIGGGVLALLILALRRRYAGGKS